MIKNYNLLFSVGRLREMQKASAQVSTSLQSWIVWKPIKPISSELENSFFYCKIYHRETPKIYILPEAKYLLKLSSKLQF